MKKRFFPAASTRGFTILEAMVATVIIATLTAIIAPNWTNFVNQQRLKGANEEIDTALRLAQSRARQENQTYSVQFRMNGNIPQMATFRTGQTPNWANITNRANFITLSLTQGDTVIFNYNGSIGVSSPIRPNEKVTLTLTGVSNSPKQCVTVQTILGAMVRQKEANCDQS